MRLFGRGAGLPAAVVGRAGLAPRERVLAWARSREGSWLLGTREALYIVADPAVASEAAASRVAWQRIDSAEWHREEERLRVTEVGDFGSPRPVHEFHADDPALLLQLVRERVTASVLMQRRVTLEGKQGFYVIARRPPTGSGEITWAYQFDPGVDPDDPQVRLAAEQALTMAADELGLG
jgi:hypothetical protein